MIKGLNILDVSEIVPKQYVGWLEAKLSPLVMTKLQSYIKTAKEQGKAQLSQMPEKVLYLEDKDDWFYQTVLTELIRKFTISYPRYEIQQLTNNSIPIGKQQLDILTTSASYCLESMWVNFQKEGEFNPLHNHTGVWTFVIWIKIPTDYKEQHAIQINANTGKGRASNFEFHYTQMLGDIVEYSYYLDKTSEGNMLFFPAKMMHCVYPFYNSEEERISLAGNIYYDTATNN
jgi:hypothetical protein